MPLVGGRRYITSTAVFLNELLKFTVCLTIALYDIARNSSPGLPATSLFSNLTGSVFTGDSWKLAIPACLYVLQSSLQYIAISNLDTATYQVTYQFKILPTALFSVLLLRSKLSARKWIALALLMFGVAIVQLPVSDSTTLSSLKEAPPRINFPRALTRWRANAGPGFLHKRSATYEGIAEDEGLEHPILNTPLGLTAAISGCIVSAAASVYFERIVKDSNTPVSLWVRNVQLSFYSLFPALFIGVIFVDGEHVAQNGFFSGYNWIVWVTVASQALGGILISLCVTYADNIAKSFAICISILISLCISVWFFDFEVTRNVSMSHFLRDQDGSSCLGKLQAHLRAGSWLHQTFSALMALLVRGRIQPCFGTRIVSEQQGLISVATVLGWYFDRVVRNIPLQLLRSRSPSTTHSDPWLREDYGRHSVRA